MPLFQKSVIQNALKFVHGNRFEEAWTKFVAHFQNPTIQENIRQSKEEQYQEGFLNDLFVNILGYVKNPNPNYNLTTELKNIKNAKKTDGAILFQQKALAVIELKGMDTTDLAKVEQQAFNYKNNQSNCPYVITSNFEKLRFYIEDAVEYEEFNLFTLNKEQFKLLYFCLHKDFLLKGKPKESKNESLTKEDTITKKLYKDYSNFRKEIFKSIEKLNPQYDRVLLFKKTQKLLDRFLFIFFAEDKGLLTAKLIEKIIEDWRMLNEKYSIKTELYDEYKKYFGYLNTGKQDQHHDIFAYNGGLFQTDELLDNLKIDSQLLAQNTLKLSQYDFESEVSVTILGHIFEHSLNELEEIENQLKSQKEETKKISKRKKDGVFYTPKYITNYIIDNTVGKICQQKRKELKIDEKSIEIEFLEQPNPQKRNKKITKQLKNNFQEYREWLLQITICDPACGSGAFLNQTLEFLIQKHQQLAEIEMKMLGKTIIDTDLEKKILENNIFGVDINQESVEIAKLSLWLRTAQKGKKLTSLNQNIKVGNSLIEDKKIANEKAFQWKKEFKEVFEKGGFDVIVGNPPYLRIQGLKDAYPKLTDFYQNNFDSATGNYDIYVLFIEKAFQLIHSKGQVSFILPHKFLISEFGEGIRKFLAEKKAVDSILHFEEHLVFEVTTYTCILNLNKKKNNFLYFNYINPKEITIPFEWQKMEKSNLHSDKWNLMSQTKINLFEKLKKQPFTAKDIFSKIFTGLQTSADAIYLIEGKIENDIVVGYSKSLDKIVEIEKELVKPLLKGQDVSKYNPPKNTYFVIFPYFLENGKAKEMSEEEIKSKFPKGYNYLKQNETQLRNRERGKMDKEGWFLYIYPKSLSSFEQQKIITPEISLGTNMTFDDGIMYHSTTNYSFILKNPSLENYKFYLSVLNSSLMWFYLTNTGYVLRGGYFTFKTKYLFPFPLPALPSDTSNFITLADDLLFLNEEFITKKNRFLRRIQDNFDGLNKITKKLDAFYSHNYSDFIKECKKQKVSFSPIVQDEWEDYFQQYKTELGTLQTQINKKDAELDNLVFELYGLNQEEIELILKA